MPRTTSTLVLAARASKAAGARAARRLQELVGAEVVALMLLGSHARGQAREASDLDLLVVTRTQAPDRRRVDADDLDLRVVTLDAFLREGVPTWLCGDPVRVLFDPEGHAARAVRVGKAVHAAGRPPLSRVALADARAWVRRMERRIETERDPALAALQLARLRLRLAELYFEVRALWPRTDRAALAYWRKNDPPVARLFEALASEPSAAKQLTLLRKARARLLRAR